MSPDRPPLSEAERRLLELLWERGPLRVRQIREALPGDLANWKRTTVITLLNRLEAKGYIASNRSSSAFEYSVVVSRDALVNDALSSLATEFGLSGPMPLMLEFARRGSLTAEDVAQLKALVAELDGPGARSQGPS